MSVILVASASANTGRNVVRQLSALGGIQIRALVRDVSSATSQDLAQLPNVTLVAGDFEQDKSIEAALAGVNRAFLVSGAGRHEQFDNETSFIAAATRANVELVVRISTHAGLIHTGYTGVYGRAHACIESYIAVHKSRVIDLCPNWFLDNWLGSAAEAKAAGTITIPSQGKLQSAYVDPRDVASAAVAVLTQPADKLEALLAVRKLEVHGPGLLSFQDKAAVLSEAVGYPIRINTIDPIVWRDFLVGLGMTKLFATAYTDTVMIAGGDKAPVAPYKDVSSPELLALGWSPKFGVREWAASAHVQAAFRK